MIMADTCDQRQRDREFFHASLEYKSAIREGVRSQASMLDAAMKNHPLVDPETIRFVLSLPTRSK
jgi:hypothetical protein